MTARAWATLVNQRSLRHSSRKRPLYRFDVAFCVCLPGSISRSVTPPACAHVSMERPQS